MSINLEREYSSYLLFFDHTFQDLIPTAQRDWVCHGGGDGNQLDFESMQSRFNDLCQTNDRKAVTLKDANTYMLYNDIIDITKTDYYTIAFWIYIPQDAFDVLTEMKLRFIPILEWDDNNGHTVKVNIAEQIQENNWNIAMTIDYSNYKKIIIPYTWTPNKWMHVLFNRDGIEGIDRVFINGKKLMETHIDLNQVNKHIFNNLKLGNMYNVDESGIFQYSIDEFCICDDIFVWNDFPEPQSYLFWLFPEVIHKTEDKDNTILNPIYGAPGFYNADKSRWDVIMDHLEITRPVYWKAPEVSQIKSRNKINFNQFHYAKSNFNYKDKNDISDIDPY